MNTIDVCTENKIHEETINFAKSNMISDKDILKLSELFKVLGDATRIKILFALSLNELCVCDIACIIGMTQSAVSHQLRILRNLRLVKYRKEGKTVFYSLDDDHVVNLFKQGLEHVKHD
ncbi:transcriptional regulator, ArsR family [Caloramator quimbayensis]|uniref:Transcriptional regulator, ArsR family n=1 Tax=Caloramator quimbayensis TaxID=1147123 RepID=A0A1T4YGC9_9CLOT|nr:metalloregulator ArsR/SmtB family transcription factor [Caloramator quimbayensis]SKB00720.1 transcriptional regulator, ArsR family [Caloramator quimbayensis]